MSEVPPALLLDQLLQIASAKLYWTSYKQKIDPASYGGRVGGKNWLPTRRVAESAQIEITVTGLKR